MDEERLRKMIIKGESELAEFKKSTSQMERALKAICAFLNHKGGVVYLGVSDKGKIIGQDVSDSTLKSISQKIRQKIKPEVCPEISVLESDGKKVIEVKVAEGTKKPYYLDGIAYKRAGSESPVIAPDELENTILNRKKRYWDSEVCDGATLKDIDEEKVEWYLRKAKYERNFDVEPETPVIEALKRLELMKNSKLTNAAVLLFGRRPQKFFLQAEIRCARFKGTEPVKPFLDMKVFNGSIINHVDKALNFALEHIPMKAYLAGKPEREEKYEYPQDAIREAIINAVCHRDYEIPANIQIRIFDDRTEIWGCGPLPEPLSLEDLKNKHNSVLRNPLIARCFFLIKYVEQRGTGTNDIISMCLEEGLPEPLFEEIAGNLVVTFRKYRISDEDMAKLNERQRNAISFLKEYGKLTNKDFQKLCPTVTRETLRKELRDLINKNIIIKKGAKRGIHYTLA